MKISKSFKIITFIFIGFLFVNNPLTYAELPNNLVIHDKPKKITNITFKDINLQDVDLSKNKGKIMVLNFWATWCAPCKEEMPSLDALLNNDRLNNLKIFPINVGKDNLEKSESFFKDLDIKNLEIYFDSPSTLAKKLSLRGIPTSIILNKEGEEFARIIGSIDFEDKKFIDWLSIYN